MLFSMGTPALGQNFFSTIELRHTFGKNWQVRYRPIATSLPSERHRTEFMLGKLVDAHWRVFSYTQLDFAQEIYHTGIRVDYNRLSMQKKLTFNVQSRTFFGLNEKSKFHWIAIPELHYRVLPKVSVGIRNFSQAAVQAKTNEFKLTNVFLGPVVWTYPSKSMLLLTYFGPNIYTRKGYLSQLVCILNI